MNTPAKDIADVLVAQGLGTLAATSGWAIFVDYEPEKPITAIVVRDTPSPAPSFTANGGASQKPLEYCQFQVTVRAGSYDAAWQKIQAVDAVLRANAGWEVAGSPNVHYLQVFRTSGLSPNLMDEADTFVRTANYRAIRQESAT